MSWTYDPNLVSDADRVRLLIGDTLESDPLISDEELVAVMALRRGLATPPAQKG